MVATPSTTSDCVQTHPNGFQAEGSISPLLTEREAANFLRLSPRSLQRFRAAGAGPAFVRAGPRRILYARDALFKWLASHTFHSGTEAESGRTPRSSDDE